MNTLYVSTCIDLNNLSMDNSVDKLIKTKTEKLPNITITGPWVSRYF